MAKMKIKKLEFECVEDENGFIHKLPNDNNKPKITAKEIFDSTQWDMFDGVRYLDEDQVIELIKESFAFTGWIPIKVNITIEEKDAHLHK